MVSGYQEMLDTLADPERDPRRVGGLVDATNPSTAALNAI